jgi:ribose transport system substrate-binding protein
MTSRWRWAMWRVVVALALLPGCGESKPVGKGKMLGVSFRTLNNPFYVEVNDGLKKAIEAHGDTLTTLDAQNDGPKQLRDIADLIRQNAAAIFINPVNAEELKDVLVKAKGIPCIIVDGSVSNPELVLCTVASDNIAAGRLAAQALFAALPNAKVVILDQPGNKASLDCVQGFEEELKQHTGAKVLDTQNGKGTTEGGRAALEEALKRNADLNAVFATDDPSALGAISALESAGKLSGVKVVGVDGSAAAAEALKAGKLLATSAQNPQEIGRIAAEQVYNYLDMQPVEKDIKVKVELLK